MPQALCAVLKIGARGRLERVLRYKLVANAGVVLLQLGVDASIGILCGVNEDRCQELDVVTVPQIGHNEHTLQLHEALRCLEVIRFKVVAVEHRDGDCLFGHQLATLVAHDRDCLELSVRAVETVGSLRDASHHLKEETRLALIFGDGAAVLLTEEGKDFCVDII